MENNTYLAALWLDNDEELYNRVQKELASAKNEAGERVAAKHSVKYGIKNGIITDSIDVDAVNWDEVVESIKMQYDIA